MVILSFILAMCLSVDTCPSIEHYVDLSIQFDKDTICMGDTLTLSIEFRNKTTEDIEFYPECYQILTQPFVAFGADKTLVLNEVSNYFNLIRLPPDGTYSQKVEIKTDNTFLYQGLNNIYMYYRCPELKGKSNEMYNKLCGVLKSNVVNLYVSNVSN